MQTRDGMSRYYQVVFIRMKDPPKFQRYLKLMGPIVRRYGGSLERQLAPESIYAQGVEKPDTINVVFYDSPEAFTAFNQDPESSVDTSKPAMDGQFKTGHQASVRDW